MRLLIIGSLGGQVAAATQIALKRGAKVAHAEDGGIALQHLRSGGGAELVMMDVEEDIASFIASLTGERINVPVVACGIGTDPDVAGSAPDRRGAGSGDGRKPQPAVRGSGDVGRRRPG